MKAILFLILLLCTFQLCAGKREIGLIVHFDYRGEVAFVHRIKTACEHLGWKADIINIEKPIDLYKKTYEFVISFVPGSYKHPACKNYLAIFDPKHHYFDQNGYLTAPYRTFDGYLLSYQPNHDFVDKKKFPHMLWYPTAQKISSQATDPAHLFYICCHWGNRLTDKKYKLCLNLLDKRPYTCFYGHPQFQKFYPRSYKGPIAYDDQSLFDIASKAGVSLVLHSADHNAFGLPSGRIFEAAAAGAVIICDQNSFVKNNFGDAVLYINTEVDGKSIYAQINHYMEWILANKKQALEKAKRAHEIFEGKFLLENQLLELEKFHEGIVHDRR